MNQLNDFKTKMQNLAGENTDLAGQVREGQEKLRLSANQIQRLVSDIDTFKRQVEQFDAKNKELERRLQETGGKYDKSQRDVEGLTR